MTIVSLSRSSACTWSQTLNDLLDASPLESRAFVLNESITNLREVIDGVVALLTPFARRRDLRLRVCVDQSVAETILADGGRLGQLVFHLLNRTIQLTVQGEISLVVRAQPLSSSSQRIFISVVNAPAVPQPLYAPTVEDPQMARWLGDAEACLPLCRILAQRMRGELCVSSDLEEGPRAIFNAPFCVEQSVRSAQTTCGNLETPPFSRAAQSRDRPTSGSFEPFDSRYLDALSEEGVDLQAFITNWREAMNDDLGRLSGLLSEGRFEHLQGVLHRLSGAVGLVGARDLMDALRRASVSPREDRATLADALMARARILVAQLEATACAYRSTSR